MRLAVMASVARIEGKLYIVVSFRDESNPRLCKGRLLIPLDDILEDLERMGVKVVRHEG